jgi:hypothetical protein
MNRREFIKSVGFGVAALALPQFSGKTPVFGSWFKKKGSKQKPNFLFILADDLGWSQ